MQAKQFILVLLYENVSSSLPVSQALREKGDIVVNVVQNASELIQTIATQKTDMVGLSVNHASTISLIRVLQEKTNVQVMLFCEDKNVQTMRKMDKLNCDLKIAGVANGYNIWMKIGHMVKAKTREDADNKKIVLSGGSKIGKKKDNKKKAFFVKGGEKKKAVGGGAEVSEEQEMRTALEQEEVSDGDAPEAITENRSVAAVAADKPINLKAPTSEGVVIKGTGPVKKTGSLLFKKKDEAKKSKLTPPAKEEPKELGQVTTMGAKAPDKKDLGGTVVFSGQERAGSQTFKKDPVDERVGKVKTQPTVADEKKPNTNVLDFQKKKKKIQERQGLKTDKKKSVERIQSRSQEKPVVETVPPMVKLRHKKQFKEAVQKALESSFSRQNTTSPGVGAVNKMTVVPVDNSKEKGFLLFCSQENDFLTAEDLEKVRSKLLEEMKADPNSDFNLGDTFNVETFDVDLCQWGEKYGQFYYHFEEEKTGKQIVVCFIKRERIYPDLKMMEDLGLYRIDLADLPPMLPVNFNAFIYFNKNNRLIPYLKHGGKLTHKQIQRLFKRGFKFLYIKEEDKSDYYSFFIALSLNQDFQPIRKLG